MGIDLIWVADGRTAVLMVYTVPTTLYEVMDLRTNKGGFGWWWTEEGQNELKVSSR